MVRPERFELPTFWFVARRSIQLSYGRTGCGFVAAYRNFLHPFNWTFGMFGTSVRSVQLRVQRTLERAYSASSRSSQSFSYGLNLLRQLLVVPDSSLQVLQVAFTASLV